MHRVTANGADIPALGFGTWDIRGAVAQSMVEAALEIGYRHIDTAQMYGNEAEVGAGIKASGLPRDEIFLTTKVWPDHFANGQLQRATEQCLARLGVQAVDLLLLHWPNPNVPLEETMAALDDVKARGLARHIGVSNFPTALLGRALKSIKSRFACNQIEYHPYLSQKALLAMQRPLGIAVTAYCPLARGRVFGDPTIVSIARRHGKTPGQVALRWLVQQQDVIAIPRSSKREHSAANFAIFDFELSSDEMSRIGALAEPNGRIVDVAGIAPDWDAPG